MMSLWSLRPLNALRPLVARSTGPNAAFMRSPAARLLHSTPLRQQATSVEGLVSHKANYIKPTPEDLKPLREAPSLYARIHMHNWDMLVTPGDLIKLPVHMKDVKVGSVLRLTECSEIGSRNHTLSGGDAGHGRIDPSVFNIKGIVVEKSRVKRQVAERTRRRHRHVRHVVSNNCLTVIRVSEISCT